MSKHTPGPWTIEENIDDVDIGPYRIEAKTCTIASDVSGIGHEAEANAILIAASPEMFTCMVGIVEAFDDNDTAGIREEIGKASALIARIEAGQ